MKLTYRAATQQDFDAFYHSCFAIFGLSGELEAKVRREWNVLISNPTTVSLVIEDTTVSKPQIVAYALAVFVSDSFVEWARKDMPPYLNAHSTRRMPDGSLPILNSAQVRKANSTGA